MKALFFTLLLSSFLSYAGDPAVGNVRKTGPVLEAESTPEVTPATKLKKNKKWKKVKKPSPVNEVPPAPLPIQ